jgi:hypothetical protein
MLAVVRCTGLLYSLDPFLEGAEGECEHHSFVSKQVSFSVGQVLVAFGEFGKCLLSEMG